ncbi:MAG: CBS domain-containing protein [Gammaproteobacteria bacterium]
MTEPAIEMMTDLAESAPYSISATASIDEANNRMITYGVRLLFVSDGRENLVGLITASDILGEKPMQYIAEHGGTRDDIFTQDIITRAENIDVLDITDVEKANVGDIVETIKDTRRQHLLVVEPATDDSKEELRGIFSTSQIARQLGIEIKLTDQASTFAEFEKALADS